MPHAYNSRVKHASKGFLTMVGRLGGEGRAGESFEKEGCRKWGGGAFVGGRGAGIRAPSGRQGGEGPGGLAS